jgi:ABC-2 type transport system ATP-binding protein
MSAIELIDLEKKYGTVEAVRGLNLVVQPGELVGLIGPNGAGKTTTLRVLTGQLLPTRGSVRVDGIDVVQDPGKARRKLGYVPEEPALYDYLSAREFLEFVVSVRGHGDLDDALALTGLGADADRLIREYSQGMRRKVALAAAMVSTPPVLVLDEALNGLDPPSAARVKAALRQQCDAGTAVLLSTHVLETVERLADRVVMIAGGRVVADIPGQELEGRDLEALFLEQLDVEESSSAQ